MNVPNVISTIFELGYPVHLHFIFDSGLCVVLMPMYCPHGCSTHWHIRVYILPYMGVYIVT